MLPVFATNPGGASGCPIKALLENFAEIPGIWTSASWGVGPIPSLFGGVGVISPHTNFSQILH